MTKMSVYRSIVNRTLQQILLTYWCSGVVMIGYVAYLKRRRNQAEDADEGIGDVDSIISEGEVRNYIPTSLAYKKATSNMN